LSRLILARYRDNLSGVAAPVESSVFDLSLISAKSQSVMAPAVTVEYAIGSTFS
jgi:hypothetical protein